MIESSDDILASARAGQERRAAERAGPLELPRFDRARVEAIGKRLTRAAMAAGAVLMLAVVIGLVMPIGLFGLLLTLLLMAIAVGVVVSRPTARRVRIERVATGDLRTLPAQTERWLQQQRPALPAPAAQLVDRISQRLDTLSPQLARVGDDTPEAGDVRKLVGEQLPAFLADYGRVPATLRGQSRNGRTPDMELIDGLTLIEQEIAAMSERLAAADVDQLATRGRYLEMRYKEGDAPS